MLHLRNREIHDMQNQIFQNRNVKGPFSGKHQYICRNWKLFRKDPFFLTPFSFPYSSFFRKRFLKPVLSRGLNEKNVWEV